MPALLNSASRPPVRSTAVAIACSAWRITDTSVWTKMAPGTAAASASPAGRSMSAITTLAPAWAKARTAASPMPLAPPVTSTVLPANGSQAPAAAAGSAMAGLAAAINRLSQAADIADGVQPAQAGIAGHVVRLAGHGGHVVRAQHTGV